METRERRLGRCQALLILMTAAALTAPHAVLAGGGQHYPNGVEAFLIGVAPPPGFYLKDYNYFYTATRLKDNDGKTQTLSKSGAALDRLTVYGTIPRLIWISKQKILGGFYGMHLFVPLLGLDFKLDAMTPGGPTRLSESHQGVGDLIFSPLLWSWHSQNGLLHIASGLDMYLPTGKYDKDNLVNIGKNHWTFEPVFAVTGFLPQDPNLSASIKLMYDFNTRNDNFIIGPSTASKIGNMDLVGLETHITPGQEFHFDYGVDYALSKSLRVGINGYFYQQVTNDKTGPGTVEHDKGMALSVGPGVWYNYRRWFFDLHGSYEVTAKNRPQGWTGILAVTYCF